MSSDDTENDDSLGILAMTALAAGGAIALWKWLGSSNEETKPNVALHFMQVANAFTDRGKYHEAMQAAQKAIEANPTDPEPYNLIAWILAINNVALDQALVAAKKAIQLASDPSNLANYHDTLAEVYARAGQLDEAIYHFRESLRLAPNGDEVSRDFSPSFRLALCYLGQGNLNLSLGYLRQALQAHPQNPVIYQAAGDECLQVQRYIEAIQHYQTALSLSQQWIAFHYPLIDDSNASQERLIFQSMCWTNMGAAYLYLREYERSRVANEEACKLYSFFPSPWINLAAIAAHNKEEQRVRQYLEKGLSLMNPFRDGNVLTYLITTQDFGQYRPIVLGLLRSHGFIGEVEYRSLLGSTPQGGASPVTFFGAQIKEFHMGDNVEGNKPTYSYSIGDITNSTVSGVALGNNNKIISNLNASGKNELAQTLKALTDAIIASKDLPAEQKEEQVNIINQIGEEAAKPKPNKSLLKMLGDGLLTALKAVPDVANAVAAAAPVLTHLHL